MTRLLIVDDSPLMRRLLGGVFAAEDDFVVETARDAAAALAALHAFAPDVVTLDITMPGMDGLQCLDRIMLERPCPVVMVSALTEDGARETLDALALGAVDFIAKPEGAVSLRMAEFAGPLVDKVRAAARARIPSTLRLRERVRLRGGGIVAPRAAARPAPPRAKGSAPGLVLVGTSTGGPPALDALLAPLPADFPWPILIAQHMPASFTGPLARRLDRLCAIGVSEVTAQTPLQPGHAYVGRGDADMIVAMRGGAPVALAAPAHPDHPWHPSTDRLVTSAMDHVAPERLVGVLMTGMGNDGAAAMTRLKQAGGETIAEAEESAIVWGMPGALVRAGGAGIVAPLDRIAASLLGLVMPG